MREWESERVRERERERERNKKKSLFPYLCVCVMKGVYGTHDGIWKRKTKEGRWFVRGWKKKKEKKGKLKGGRKTIKKGEVENRNTESKHRREREKECGRLQFLAWTSFPWRVFCFRRGEKRKRKKKRGEEREKERENETIWVTYKFNI